MVRCRNFQFGSGQPPQGGRHVRWPNPPSRAVAKLYSIDRIVTHDPKGPFSNSDSGYRGLKMRIALSLLLRQQANFVSCWSTALGHLSGTLTGHSSGRIHQWDRFI